MHMTEKQGRKTSVSAGCQLPWWVWMARGRWEGLLPVLQFPPFFSTMFPDALGFLGAESI